MIVQELSSLGGGLHSLSAPVFSLNLNNTNSILYIFNVNSSYYMCISPVVLRL